MAGLRTNGVEIGNPEADDGRAHIVLSAEPSKFADVLRGVGPTHPQRVRRRI
jgi:hypothetical protein